MTNLQSFFSCHCSHTLLNLQPKLIDEKQTTVYKKDAAVNYQLKMKASRFIISEIKEKFPHMPFTARCLLYLVKLFLLFYYCLHLLMLFEITINIDQSRRKGHVLDLWSV